MSMQKVNTESISAMANAISTTNTTLNSEFYTVQTAGNTMDANWNSDAGGLAISKMYQLFRGNEERSAVMENHANFLRNLVVTNYNASETENTKLSDLFL